MPRRFFVLSGLLFALFFTAAWFGPGRIAGAIEASTPAVPSPNSHSALMLIENVGQFADDARFQVRGSDRTIWLAEDAIWVTLGEPAVPTALPLHEADPLAEISTTDTPRRGVNLRLSFVGANPAPFIHTSDPVSTTISYFYGNDSEKWRPDVPVWSNVRYEDLYPGLDLELVGQGSTLTPRLICHAADCATALAAVQLEVAGAEALTLAEEGLLIETAVGEWRLPLLSVVDEEGRPVEIGEIAPSVVESRVEQPFAPPAAQSSMLNPLYSPAGNDLLYSTYLGSTEWDRSYAIAVDEAGNAFATGFAGSSNFPTTPGAFDTVGQGSLDIFVTKFNAAGSDLLYSTFLGGEDGDLGYAIAVDEAGNAYVTGRTHSPDLPTTPGAFDITYNGEADAFVTKLNATGSDLLYSTFLGGEHEEEGVSITVDGLGNAFITGATFFHGFPTTPDAFDTIGQGFLDIFVTKFNAAGSDLLYSTYLGGADWDRSFAIAVDGSGNAFVTGSTSSPDFPTTPGAFDTTYSSDDAFVTKLNADGSSLLYSTFLGGWFDEEGHSIAVDGTGNAFITGRTQSYDFPTTPNAFDTIYDDDFYYDAFVTQLNAAGSDLLYSTLLGGEGDDEGNGIAVDEVGNAFVTGFTEASDFPTTPGAFDTVHNGSQDVFVVKFNAAGNILLYGTFLGGDYGDVANGMVLDGAGNVFITGYTGLGLYAESDDLVVNKAAPAFVAGYNFPTTPDAFDTTFNGFDDGFVARLVPENALLANFVASPTSGVAPVEVTFSNLSTGDYDTCLWDFGDGNNSISCLDPVHTYTDYGLFTVSLTITGTQGATTLTRPDYIAVYEYEPVAASFTITPTIGVSPLTIYLTNLSTGDYDTCLWDFGDGGNSGDCDEPSYTYDTPGIYTVSLTVTGPGGEDTFTAVDLIIVYTPVTAGFSATPTSGTAPLFVFFTNLSTGDYDTCLWEFGDGSTSGSCGDRSHTYDTPGSYTVSLTVMGAGGEDTFTALIAVYEPVHAHFMAAPTSGLAPLFVLFTNLATGDYTTCQWDFGDGSTSSHCSNPGHTYTTPGSYAVSLTVTGLGGEDTFTAVDLITIYEPVTAGFTATPTSGNVPLLVQFSNLATGDYDTCLWEFGDGNTSDECDNPTHTYTAPGTYTVTLTVSGPGGEDTLVQADYVTVKPYQLFLPLMMGTE